MLLLDLIIIEGRTEMELINLFIYLLKAVSVIPIILYNVTLK